MGPWRVVGLRGQGTYGAVYRAVRVGQEASDPVALKLAVYPQDPRFERELELLPRSRHPSIPRLLDHGGWHAPSGATHPYLVMEWVEGTPLYDWARQHNPSSQQVFQLLADLAWALDAAHAAGGVHRDVKGDNVLVRHEDHRAVLLDFGAGTYQGARPLTPPPMPPGTPAYRPPEAWLSAARFRRLRVSHIAGPPDDLFALGVTAYRLVTGEYPPPMEPREDASGLWHLDDVPPPPPLALNPRVVPQLSELIVRMLSMNPEERGTTGELAEALEQAAKETLPEADQPLFTPETQPPSSWGREEAAFVAVFSNRLRPELLGNAARLRALRRRRGRRDAVARCRSAHLRAAPSERAAPRAAASAWRLLLGAAAVVLFPLLCGRSATHDPVVEMPAVAEAMPEAERPDAGPVAVGDSFLTAPRSIVEAPSGWKVIKEDVPDKPFPGQSKPDAMGRCPRKGQVIINGGCWVPLALDDEACVENGYLHQGRCYSPAFPPRRQPTSTPQDSR